MPYHQLLYHFVWGTRGRQPLIQDGNRGQILESISGKARDLGAHVHALTCMPDHVHLVVGLPPAVAPAPFIGQVKGLSSHVATRVGGEFAWQAEYGVVTVSESNLTKAVAYVQNQAAHHSENTVHSRMEA